MERDCSNFLQHYLCVVFLIMFKVYLHFTIVLHYILHLKKKKISKMYK